MVRPWDRQASRHTAIHSLVRHWTQTTMRDDPIAHTSGLMHKSILLDAEAGAWALGLQTRAWIYNETGNEFFYYAMLIKYKPRWDGDRHRLVTILYLRFWEMFTRQMEIRRCRDIYEGRFKQWWLLRFYCRPEVHWLWLAIRPYQILTFMWTRNVATWL